MPISFFFFFNDTATTEIYTLSLHDALPIWVQPGGARRLRGGPRLSECLGERPGRCRAALSLDVQLDRKSTRLNSSHLVISYAVFCLKKKNKEYHRQCVRAHVDAVETLRHAA